MATLRCWALVGFALLGCLSLGSQQPDGKVVAGLVARYGESQRVRIERGVRQVRGMWRKSDGDFDTFVKDEFLPLGQDLDLTFERLEFALERLDGYANSIARDLRRWADLELGPQLAIDERLAGLDPYAHLNGDLFDNKVAFVALLNFPLTTLEERLSEGGKWTRRQWAESRLAERFASRVPAEVATAITVAYASAQSYIANYNIFTHHVLTKDGRRLFPAGQRLLSHWNLRDEIKANYAGAGGLEKQRLLEQVMSAIVEQSIPAAVIDNPLLDWTPETGSVSLSNIRDVEAPRGSNSKPDPARENDARYRHWLKVAEAERLADRHEPSFPSFLARRFERYAEMPEADVEKLLVSVLDSPVAEPVAKLIEARLGRKLEPFDIYYDGFKSRARYSGAELDAITRKRYPNLASFALDLPRILRTVGFSEGKAKFLSERIEVDPARGSGHALGPRRRDDKAHLRTRFDSQGMDYKSFNIAIHEMGHNVEQVFSVTTIDHTLLQGVPNVAFTEALAFLFQARDMAVLGLPAETQEEKNLRALDQFWAAREIAGAGLVDLEAWRWLAAHPKSDAASFRKAVVDICRKVWARHFAKVCGGSSTLLGVYSHCVDSGLYLPDYTLARLIAFQIEHHFEKKPGPIGAEFERLAKIGSITPDQWMRQAVGAGISAEPLLAAAALAVRG